MINLNLAFAVCVLPDSKTLCHYLTKTSPVGALVLFYKKNDITIPVN